LNCYCTNIIRDFGAVGAKVLFEDKKKHCSDWYLAFSYEQYSSIILAAFIALMNLVLHLVFNWMGKLRRTKDVSSGRIYQTLSILIAQYVNTVMIF